MDYKRLFVPNGYIHIVVVAYQRKPILIDNINFLRNAFKNAKKHFDFEIFAICILPDHFHLIIKPKDVNEYPKIITSVKYYVSRNIDVGVETPTYGYKNKDEKGIWQRRYFEHTIRDESDLHNHLDYIHYNPVRHCYVKAVKDWEFSSFGKFVETKNYDENWGSFEDVKHIETLEYD